MIRSIVLLKGVNVGGNRRLPMADLRAMLTEAGYSARTLLASGNVVVEATHRVEEAAFEALLETRMGLKTAVLVRDPAEWQSMIAANPFPEQARDRPQHLIATFYRDPPDATQVDALRAAATGPEAVALVNRTLFIDYRDGIGESTLPQAMARLRFPAVATARNWNTVLKLGAMLDS